MFDVSTRVVHNSVLRGECFYIFRSAQPLGMNGLLSLIVTEPKCMVHSAKLLEKGGMGESRVSTVSCAAVIILPKSCGCALHVCDVYFRSLWCLGFDPTFLERGAKALREIDESENADEVLNLMALQEKAKAADARVRVKQLIFVVTISFIGSLG